MGKRFGRKKGIRNKGLQKKWGARVVNSGPNPISMKACGYYQRTRDLNIHYFDPGLNVEIAKDAEKIWKRNVRAHPELGAKDNINPRIKVIEGWRAMRRRGETEYNYVHICITPRAVTFMFWSVNTYFFYRESRVCNTAQFSCVYDGRERALRALHTDRILWEEEVSFGGKDGDNRVP